MVYRYSWIAGLASVAFAYWQLGGLLLPTARGAKWQLVVLSGFAIALIVTWTAITYRLRSPWIIVLNLVALFLAAARFSAPEESVVVLPTPAGLSVLWSDLTRAFDVIRNNVEPVLPITGIVIILTTLFWVLGALLAWGLSKDHPFVGLLPPLVVAVQFATLDRRGNSFFALTIFVVIVAGTVLAVALDERDRGAGRMAGSSDRRPSHGPSITASALLFGLIALAALGAGALGPRVPYDGVLAWRTPGGLGGGFYGSFAINPYVQIHDGLVSQRGIPLFSATLDLGDGIDPGDVSFRLLTMESYQDGRWGVSQAKVYRLDEPPNEAEGMEYAGPTASVVADIEIHALSQEWLPAPYAVGGAVGEDGDAFRIRRLDTSVSFRGARTYPGMQYRTLSRVPILEAELVATAPDGELDPLFATAAAAGETPPEVVVVASRELPEADLYTELPTDLDPRIERTARELTANLDTDFAKGMAIEYWFRESGGFVYDLDADTDFGDDVLATWLFDPDVNPGYRRGYCEQFATAMAVMTRSIGIPTRVVLGFTPGERVDVDTVTVFDKNAHSWIELWIPQVGWLPFDPTPRNDNANPVTAYGSVEDDLGYDLAAYLDQVPERPRPEFDNAGGGIGGRFPEDRLTPTVTFLGGGGEATAPQRIPGWVSAVALVFVLLALVVLAVPILKWTRHRGRMRRLGDGDVSAAWEEIVVQLTDLGEEPDPAATPVELADRVDNAMRPLAAVYSRAVYGPEADSTRTDVAAARRSMELTTDRLATRYSSGERMRARFRIGSLRRRFR